MTPEPPKIAGEKMPRGQRRRLKTRQQLVDAARKVMAEKGVGATTIQDITEAADVGFGSFYNHFESKDAILDEVVRLALTDHGEQIDATISGVSDPALALTIALATYMRRVDHDPVLGWFIVRVGTSRPEIGDEIAGRLRRDIRRGVDAGVFTVPHFDAALYSVRGVIFAATLERLRGNLGPRSDGPVLQMVLRLLGVPDASAVDLVRRANVTVSRSRLEGTPERAASRR